MITVSDEVVELIKREGCDYRVCTVCKGSGLVPITIKGPKASDIKIPVGDNILYVSSVQARYITEVTIDMLCDEYEINTCPAFYYR